MTTRRTVNRSLFMVVAVAFLLPFVTVSCMGEPVGRVDGITLAVGGSVTADPGFAADGGAFLPDPPAELGGAMGEGVPLQPAALVAALLAAAGVAVAFSPSTRASTVLGWIGAAGVVSLVVLRLSLLQELAEVSEMGGTVSYGAGWWLATAGFAAAAAYNAAAYWQPRPALADRRGNDRARPARSAPGGRPPHGLPQGRSPILTDEEAVALTSGVPCGACGSPLAPAARFCSACGAPQPPPPPVSEPGDGGVMFCPACGVRNAHLHRFCQGCGTALPALEAGSGHETATPAGASQPLVGPAPATPAPHATEAPRPASAPAAQPPGWVRSLAAQLQTGWPQAALAAVGAAMALFLAGFAAAVAIRFALGDGWASVGAELPLYKLAGLVVFALARVPLMTEGAVDAAALDAGGQGELVLPLLGGLLLVAAVLFAAGRYAASAAGVTRLGAAAAQGVKVAPLLAGVALAASYAVRVTQPQGWLGPSPRAALGWTLLWGGIFATLGALSAAGGRRWLSDWAHTAPGRLGQWAHGIRAAVAAAGVGLTLSLLVALVVLGVVAAQTETLPLLAEAGLAARAAALLATLLYLPNLAVQVLGFAHGGTYLAEVSGPFLNETIQINYLTWPGNYADPLAAPWVAAPWMVYALLAIPAAAVLWGGYAAAARTQARSVADVQRLALAVGTSYALLLGAMATVERARLAGEVWANTSFAAGAATLGFSLLGAFVLPLVWGIVGGYVGARAWLARTGRGRAPRRPGRPRTARAGAASR